MWPHYIFILLYSMFSIKYLISFVFIHLNTIIFPKLQKTFHNIAIQEGILS